jgi:hypothetical protein
MEFQLQLNFNWELGPANLLAQLKMLWPHPFAHPLPVGGARTFAFRFLCCSAITLMMMM